MPIIFAATIRNQNTRTDGLHAVSRFFAWCEHHRLGALDEIEPHHFAACIGTRRHFVGSGHRAHAGLDAVKRARLLDGFRNLPKAERATLVEIIIRVSGFAADQADIIAELDANPLLRHAHPGSGRASRSDCGGVACFPAKAGMGTRALRAGRKPKKEQSMSETKEKAPPGRHQNPNTQAVRVAFNPLRPTEKPQEFYDKIKQKFAEERDLRLSYRPDGRAQYTSDLTGELAKYEIDPWVETIKERAPINDTVECLFIGGGFSALLTAARLREKGVESIRIVERGGDVGGTWYWNRYPGAACDVSAYDYLPLLDELNHVPNSFFAKGPEIFAHCQAIAHRYNLYELAVFQTTVTSTIWDEQAKLWRISTDRGDTLSARFVICANGTLSKPKLSKINGMEILQGPFLP